nr:antirestriction protein ArdA [Eggerthella lenta]
VRERLGVENEEQLEIADYELPFEVHSEMPLWEINVKCRIVQEIEGTPIGNEMKSIIQRWFYGFDEFID